MTVRKSHCHAGLDIGAAAVRAVLVQDGRPVDFQEWKLLSEGGLEESEIYDGAAALLKKVGWEKYPLLAGLPQFRCSTLYKVFPAGAESRLRQMVAFETEQLAGVTEERFINAFCSLKAPADQSGRPVLIGICRERDVEEAQHQYLSRSLNLSGMSMHGLALLNTFYYLHPEAMQDEKPVLLLDLGHVNATVVIAAAGRALFMGTLMFAGERFLQALEKCNQVLERRGSSLTLDEVDFENEALHSPLLEAARALDSEIQDIVEHWRSQESDEYCSQPVSCIWLSGGGARIGTLPQWLSNGSDIPVKILGPRCQGEIRPEYAVSLGLALESGGASVYALPFLSPALAEKRRQAARFPILAAACLFFCLSLFAVELLCWFRQARCLETCRTEYSRLDSCGNILPGIQFMYLDLKSREKKILPLVINGRRTDDILQAVRLLSDTLGDREWCVYLSDYESYVNNGKKNGASGIKRNRQPEPAGTGFFGSFETASEDESPEFPRTVQVNALLTENPAWIAAGFVPFNEVQPYFHVKKLTLKLREKPFFRDSDLFQSRNELDRMDIFLPWVRFLKEKSRDYKSFMLLIPRKSHWNGKGEDER